MPKLTCISLRDGCTCAIPERTVLCLGNFDGVHRAHQEILQKAVAVRDAQLSEATVGVFCFRELPAAYLGGDAELLCDLRTRLERFAHYGAEIAILAEFPDLRELSPADYIEQILIRQCGAVAVVCGFNHRFGHRGKGTPALLRERFGALLYLVDAVTWEGEPISSSRIRTLLREGRMETACRMLGTPYSLTAPVLHGKALGRTIGIPTVNQNFPRGLLIPPRGVYVTETVVDGVTYRGVSNVGTHPTVDADAPVNCETYLLDFEGDLYEKTLTVSFLRYLREERRFEALEDLRQQIKSDIAEARK